MSQTNDDGEVKMVAAVETMAYAGDVPWHGLGRNINPTSSVDQMLKAAGLDWKVEKKQLKYEQDGKLRDVTGRYALVRETDNRVLTITGPDWKPLQNRDAMEFFREYTEVGGAKMETAGSLRGGKIVWGLANLGHGFSLKGGDKVNGYLLLVSPHEVGQKISARTTAVRVVCWNTLVLALRTQSAAYYSQNHLKEFDPEEAKATIGLANENMVTASKKAAKLQKLKMTDADHIAVLAPFFQPSHAHNAKEVQELIENPDMINKRLGEVLLSLKKAPGATPGNAWGTLNAVTHWADHVAGRSVDARLTNAWIGEMSRVKLRVEEALLEMAA
jgi:phage/plasmid-like protein (TIGR03299 family)